MTFGRANRFSCEPKVTDYPAAAPRARSRAASTCRVVHGKTGMLQSAWWMRSSSSVQPRRTPSAPASQSSSMMLDDPAAGAVDDVAVDQLVVDRGVEVVVVRLVGDQHLEAVGLHPVGEEAVGHGDRGADEADPRHPGGLAGAGHHVGEVQQRDADGGLHLVGDLVERGRAEQQEVRPGPLDTAPGVGEQGADLVPLLGVLELGEPREVDGRHHQLRRREPAEPPLDPEVEVPVVGRAALPAHAADQADGLHLTRRRIWHEGHSSTSNTRCTLCWAACARGRITSSSTLTCAGRVTIQPIASATSSATSGSATPA